MSKHNKNSSKVKSKKCKHINMKKVLFVFLTTCVSLGFILYPYISNFVYEHQKDGIVNAVEQEMQPTNKDKYKDIIKNAQKYNDELVNGAIQLKDPFDETAIEEDANDYNSQLCMTEDGVMGILKIPCIDVSLPIYHGTTADVLERGVGHLQGTSLPIGGKSTHSVLTGHSGLSSAKLFTDLTALKEGDLFFLYVAGRTLAYEVDDISVVLPEEMAKLTVEKDKDYCTLVTCTPYGVNTHRLLVRGKRIPYSEQKEKEAEKTVRKTESQWMKEYTKSIIIAAVSFIGLLIILIIWRYFTALKKKKRHSKKRHKKES